MSFPLTYIQQNLIMGRQRQVWAAYRLQPWHYEYRSYEERLGLLQRLARLLWHLEDLEGQLLLLPRPHALAEHLQSLGHSGDPVAAWYAGQAVQALPTDRRQELMDYDYLLLLRISETPSLGAELQEMGRGLLRSPRRFLQDFSGTGPWSIASDTLAGLLDREEQVYLRVSRAAKAIRLTSPEVASLISRRFGGPPLPTDWQQPVAMENDRIRPDTEALAALADGEVHLDRPGHLRLVTPSGAVSYHGFGVLADVPDDMPFPGGEWIFGLQDLPFPVELCLRWQALNWRQGLAESRKRRLELGDQDEHTRKSGQDLPLSLLEAQEDVLLLEHDLKQRKSPLLDLTVHLGVAGATAQQLQNRLRHLKEYLQTHQLTMEVPSGDLTLAFADFLPGTQHALKDYTLRLPPEALAAGMFLASKSLGDESGPYIGRVGLLHRPVYLDPSLPPRINRTASMAFLGSLGGGKSFTANLLTYLAATTRSARTLILDPKGERGAWPDLLPELRDQLRVITLGSNPADRGTLDPFVIGRTLGGGDQAETAQLAVSLLSFLVGAQTGDARFLAIMEAVERVRNRPDAALTGVLAELESIGRTDPEVQTTARYLRVLAGQGYAHLLFGDATSRGLDLGARVSILQVQHLQLPPAGKPRAEYTLEELVSVGLMHAVTAYATRFALQDRHVFKVVLLDEAWALLQSAQGKQLIAQLLRMGRSLNTAIYLVTQNCADLLDETIKNNLGTKFIFRSQDSDEIAQVLQFLNLQASSEAADAVRGLETGQALIQDLYGRVGMVRIDALLPHLATAFDTAPQEVGR